MAEPRPPTNPLLHTKLMPPRLHSTVVRRPELLAQLDEGLDKRLTLVTAPTGFGKSTLVSMWLAERGMPSAWVTLDENDNDPVRFWTYLITALRRFDPAIGKTALAALMAPQPAPFLSVLTPLINDLERVSQPGVLVLEDYQAITAPEIHSGVAFLLQHLTAALHLVIISRSAPDLPLGILRARDELLEIDAGRLRFSLGETEAFLRQALQVELPPPALARLQARTEGWAAGLRLAALALQGKDSPGDPEKLIQFFSGSHRYVADYLIREVFAGQPQPKRDFLLQTCFLERLTGSLCDAVTGTGGGETALEQLERENLFLVRLETGGGRTWYRYNPLFAESIQYLARQQLGEAGVRAIYAKASTWYETQQMFQEAIEAALRAELFEPALELIETFIDINSMREVYTLQRWLERIPAELVLSRPEICLAYAQIILFTSDRYAPETALRLEPYLRAAEQTWRAQGQDEKLGKVSAMYGMVLLWQMDFQKAFAYVHRSLEELPEDDIFWRGVSLLNAGFEAVSAGQMLVAQDRVLEARALMGASQNLHGVLASMQFLSEIFYWQGDLEQCVQLSQEIMEQASGGDEMLDDQGIARMNLASVAYERNDLPAAEAYASQAFELGKQRANESLQAQAVIRLARVDAARGSFTQAQERLKTFVSGLQNGTTLREVQCTQARIALWAGQADSVDWWQSLVAVENPNQLPVQQEAEAFTLARLRIAQGKPGEARKLIKPWQVHAAENGRLRSQVEGGCIEALALHAGGDFLQSRQVLTRALTPGHARGFCRLFLDEGPPLAALLQDFIPAQTNRPLSLYAGSLLRALSADATFQPVPGGAALVEPLSQQETRVLRLLAAGLTNAEIAQELVVSTNTVKTHVKNIYRKLAITSRDEARQAVKEMNLL